MPPFQFFIMAGMYEKVTKECIICVIIIKQIQMGG